MKTAYLKTKLTYWALSLALLSGATSGQAAFTIEPGWTLLQTSTGTDVNLPFVGWTPFIGVPFGNFDFTQGEQGDFGRGIGTKFTATTDSFAKRLSPAVAPGSNTTVTIPVELIGLQLRSVNRVGGPFNNRFVFVTLQSARGGPATLGQMMITFDDNHGGSFTNFFEVYYDYRLDSVDGPIVASYNKPFYGHQAAWSRTPPTNAFLVPRVNHLLNGTNAEGSFYVSVALFEDNADGHHYAVPVLNLPVLSIGLTGGQTRLTWTDTLGRFMPQRTHALGSAAFWADVTNSVVIVNGRSEVMVDNSQPAGYFRLLFQ